MRYKAVSLEELLLFGGNINPTNKKDFLDALPDKDEGAVVTVLKQFVKYNIHHIYTI